MIESLQNEKIKNLVRLSSDNRFRKKSGVFVVEGKQENERAIKFGYQPQEFFICENIYNEDFPKGKISLVSEKIYEKIAYRGSSEGIIGIFIEQSFNLLEFDAKEHSTIIIVEGVEKPGNLGAILRSCEAFGIDALIVTDAKVDFFNPNVIRSSVGCLFGMNIFSTSNTEALAFLRENNYKVYTTYMDEQSVEISKKDFRQKSAVIFGTEHSGISDFWFSYSENILIPMSGTIDSLNLSNAVAIACYETLRQKRA